MSEKEKEVEERDGLILDYKSKPTIDSPYYYAPFNPLAITEEDELWIEIELIEDERQEAKRKHNRK